MSSIVVGLTPSEIAALPLYTLAQFDVSDIAALTTDQVAALTAADLDALAYVLGSLSAADIEALDTGSLGAVATRVIAAFRPSQIADLTLNEVAALGARQLTALDKRQVAAMTAADIAALAPSAMLGLGVGKVAALSTAQAAALTCLQIIGMTRRERAALSGTNSSALSLAAINSLSPAALQQLSGFTSAQIAGFSPATIAKLSVAEFDQWIAPEIGALSTGKIARLTIAELQSLSGPQIAMLTGAQRAAMSTAQLAAIDSGSSTVNPILQDALSHEVGGSLGYSGALAVLQDAAKTAMNATAFSELTTLAQDLNVTGGVAAPADVQQMFDNVVLGNSANAQWNGGANTPTALGDLSANSTTAEFDDLIGKWFLGTDMPGTELRPDGQSSDSLYQAYSLPLYATGAPVMTDVAQGQVGDCWFLAALAETAEQDPSLIENMITANGNGTYTVELQSSIAGQPNFVTVNDEFPTFTGGADQMDGSKMEFANSQSDIWAPIVEKALAQLSAEAGVTTGSDYSGLGNQYLALTAGNGEGITFVTGQSVVDDDLANLSSGGQSALLSSLQASLASGQDVLLGTSDLPISGNLVDDHMFAVTSVNAATGIVGLFNPWGANASGSGVAESFSISISALIADEATFFQAAGTRATA